MKRTIHLRFFGKSILSTLVVVALVSLLAVNSFASYRPGPLGEIEGVESATVNEFKHLKSLGMMDADQLRENGYEDDEVNLLQDYEKIFRDELFRRSMLDDKELVALGYSADQIRLLRSFDGSEEQMVILSANLTWRAFRVSHYYDQGSNRTYAQMYWDWEWNVAPLPRLWDIVGMCWSEAMYLDQSAATFHRIYRAAIEPYWQDVAVQPHDSTHAALTKWDTEWPPGHWAKKGYGFIRVSRLGYIPEFAMILKYGRGILSITPSISVTGAPGFSFTFGVQEISPPTYIYSQIMY